MTICKVAIRLPLQIEKYRADPVQQPVTLPFVFELFQIAFEQLQKQL